MNFATLKSSVAFSILLHAACIMPAHSQNSPDSGNSFESARYGLKTRLPKEFPLLAREKNEYVFVCEIPQEKFPERPGILACELAIAPESLEEYRSRIEGNARRGNRMGELTRNTISPKSVDGLPERLESVWEFRLPNGEIWHEITIRLLRGKHLYSFILNIEDENLKSARPSLDAVIRASRFSIPDSGATQVLGASTNRWIQTEFQFVVDLPKDWSPLLAPNEAALLYANGKPKGIWADNMLILATKAEKIDYEELSRTFARDLEIAEPGCRVLKCEVIRNQKGDQILETQVQVERGPFSMTILEWRFPGKRYNYELKFTIETSRFEELRTEMQKCFESFLELSEDSIQPEKSKS